MKTSANLRGILAACAVLSSLSFAEAAHGNQTTAKVLLKVAVIDKDLNVKPVPKFTFLLNSIDRPEEPSTRIVTGFDGTTMVSIQPGNYIVKSESPLEFEGNSLEWSIEISVAPEEEKLLELSNDNAIIRDLSEVAEQEPGPDKGSVSGNVYTNEYFGFSYQFPEGWTAVDKENQQVAEEFIAETIVGENKALGVVVKAAQELTYTLLRAFQHPPGTPGIEFNSNLQIHVEDASSNPGVKTGKDYLLGLQEAQKLMRMLGMKGIRFKMISGPTPYTFGGKEFFRADFDVRVKLGGSKIRGYQAWIVTILREHILKFVFATDKRQRLDELCQTVESLAFFQPESEDSTQEAQQLYH